MFLDSEITPTATSTPTVQLTEKILKEAYEQQKEVEDEENAPMSAFSQQSLYEVEEVLDDDVDVFEIQLDYKDMACSEKEENLLLDALLSQGRGFNSRTCLGCITTSTNQLEDKDVAATCSACVSETNYYPKHEKMPKALNHVIRLGNWESLLKLTEPESWSPNAMYKATNMFASSSKAGRFL
ncbi:unnamed protein product [Brassica oleracea]